MQKDDVVLKKVNFLTAITAVPAAFRVISAERSRISRWLPVFDESIIPTERKLAQYMLSDVIQSLRRKWLGKMPYNERFLIFVDGKFGGMIGLEDINKSTKDAEVWTFVSKNYEGQGVAQKSMKLVESYAFKHGTNTLFGRIDAQNTRSQNFSLNKGGFVVSNINQYGVVTCKKNIVR